MEPAPLIKAHDHAKAASSATQTADTTVAINEHALAAGEFSNAAQGVTSMEALRTLKLLEQHHHKLSELLKFPTDSPLQQSAADDAKEKQVPASVDNENQTHDKAGVAARTSNMAKPATSQSSLSQQQRPYPPRGLTSSIARNLASARGIKSRGQPLAPAVSNDQAPGNVDVQPRRDGSKSKIQNMIDQGGKPSWVPPAQGAQGESDLGVSTPDAPKAEELASVPADEGYSRFYNTFGSLLNRISAPLAFAGLPLVAEESVGDPPATTLESSTLRRPRHKPSHTSTDDPDLSKIFSKAALRAVSRDGTAATDSFYVVPTSGHTVSYANILTFDQKERRRMAASTHGDEVGFFEDPDEEDFVDAKESQAPLSPGFRKRLGRSRSEKDLYNVVEELYLENKSMKAMLDKVTRRLHAFEASAQTSHLALAESMRLMRPGSPMSNSGKREVPGEILSKRNKELEDELAAALKKTAALEDNLAKYRDKWEKLKAGAKKRREAQSVATSNSAPLGSPS